MTDFHRKLYQILSHTLPDCTHFIPSQIGNQFSPEEMSRITGMFIHYRDKLNEQALAECIQNLLSAKVSPDTDLSDNALAARFADKKKNTRLIY